MDERRSYVRKSLHSTVSVFDRNTNEYVGLLADYSEDGLMVTSSVKPVAIGNIYQYLMLVQSPDKPGGTDRAEIDAESVWCDRTSPSFYGTGYKLIRMSENARAVLDACTVQ